MEEPWLWNARYGHLSFDALGRLEKMVRGLPHIKHGGELCDSCLAGKQRRLPFPKVAKYRAKFTATSAGRSRLLHAVVGGTFSCSWMITVTICGCNS